MHSYYQALALRALGDEQRAVAVLAQMAEVSAERMMREPKVDYFATSLPAMLLFHEDLSKRNRVEALLLNALASEGLGDRAKAVTLLRDALTEDPNHLFAAEMLRQLEEPRSTV